MKAWRRYGNDRSGRGAGRRGTGNEGLWGRRRHTTTPAKQPAKPPAESESSQQRHLAAGGGRSERILCTTYSAHPSAISHFLSTQHLAILS